MSFSGKGFPPESKIAMITDMHEQTDYLDTLLQLGQTLNSSLDLHQVLHTAMEQVVSFVGAERGFILLVEQRTKRVRGKVTHDIDPLALESLLAGRDPSNRPEISRTIVETALRDRHPILSTNAMEDPRFAERTSVQLASVRSVLCVPLMARGDVIGIIYLDNRVRSGLFNEHHLEMLTAFANQAAVAIQNARLYEDLRKSMEERLRLSQELHEKEAQRRALEEANRLKTEFIGYVSHELRNPLTTIRGYIQTLANDREGKLEPEIRQEFFETIEAETDRMLNMINDLLDSSRLKAGGSLSLHLRRIQIRPVLERMAGAQRFHKSWTPEHRMRIDIAPDLPEIEADEDKIHQIISNLLSNAIKFSPNGGEITLSARPVRGGIEVSVQDQGLGMTEEQCARLFQPFERLEREEIAGISGTGLGLYLTRHLVELHGGTIACISAPGKGTTFTLFLPLAASR